VPHRTWQAYKTKEREQQECKAVIVFLPYVAFSVKFSVVLSSSKSKSILPTSCQ
jgi:hypothetical protein